MDNLTILNIHYKIQEFLNFQLKANQLEHQNTSIFLNGLKILKWGTKDFNTNFGPEGLGYLDRVGLKVFKNNENLLKNFLKSPQEPKDNLKLLKDVFMGLNHKISGCGKFLKAIFKMFQVFKTDYLKQELLNDVSIEKANVNLKNLFKEEFKSEMDRIKIEIMDKAEDYQELMYKAMDLLEDVPKEDISNLFNYEENLQGINEDMDLYDIKLLETQKIYPKLKQTFKASCVNVWKVLLRMVDEFDS